MSEAEESHRFSFGFVVPGPRAGAEEVHAIFQRFVEFEMQSRASVYVIASKIVRTRRRRRRE